MPKKTYNLKRIEWKSGEKVVYFFPLYRLEIKTLSDFKLNPKHNDFYGLWLDSWIISTLFPNVTSVAARLYTVQCKRFWQDAAGCSVE